MRAVCAKAVCASTPEVTYVGQVQEKIHILAVPMYASYVKHFSTVSL